MIMKKQNLLQVLMAMAVTFAVQTPAQAQLGGLMKKAKKVAEQTVKQTTGTEQGSASVNAGDDARLEKAQADYEKEHPAVQERKNAEAVWTSTWDSTRRRADASSTSILP